MGIRKIAIAASLALFVGGVTLAPSDAHAGIQGREANQRSRIAAGWADGSLTGREAVRLAHQQARVERYERRSRRDDGRLDARERARIHRGLTHTSASIYRARHNDRER